MRKRTRKNGTIKPAPARYTPAAWALFITVLTINPAAVNGTKPTPKAPIPLPKPAYPTCRNPLGKSGPNGPPFPNTTTASAKAMTPAITAIILPRPTTKATATRNSNRGWFPEI